MNPWLRKNASNIFTAIGVIGVPLSMWLTHRADCHAAAEVLEGDLSPKWRHYIPAILCGGCTMASIIMSRRVDQKAITVLAGAVGAGSQLLKDFQEKTKEIAGEETYDDITRAVAEKRLENAPKAEVSTIGYVGGFNSDSIDIANDGETIFYWLPTDREFRSSRLAVQAAEYHINRNLQLRGYTTLSEIFAFLGLSIENDSDFYMGWTYDYLIENLESPWLDFSHTKMADKDGNEVYVICPDLPAVYIDEQ